MGDTQTREEKENTITYIVAILTGWLNGWLTDCSEICKASTSYKVPFSCNLPLTVFATKRVDML